MVAVLRGSESGVLYGVVDTGTGSFLISAAGATGVAGAAVANDAAEPGGGALAGRGAGVSSFLFHMLTVVAASQ
jgi:hypothetical protein